MCRGSTGLHSEGSGQTAIFRVEKIRLIQECRGSAGLHSDGSRQTAIFRVEKIRLIQ